MSSVPGPDTTMAAENARLRARIEALEAELAATRTLEGREPRSEYERLRRDIPTQVADEGTRVVKALAQALAEQLRATADVVSAVADEAFRRREERAADERDTTDRPSTSPVAEDQRGTRTTRSGRTAEDLSAVINTGIERAVEIPRRVIERLSDAYRKSR
jgi:hypothetical protein